MKLDGTSKVLLPLLCLSAGLNIWFLFRADAPADEKKTRPVMARVPVQPPAPQQGRPEASSTEGPKTVASVPGAPALLPPEQRTPDELIYGMLPGSRSAFGEPGGKVSPQRLKELADAEPSKAAKFRVKARLMLPGDRAVDIGIIEIPAGHRAKLELVRELPHPTAFDLPAPAASPASVGSFPVTPTVPAAFASKNLGMEMDIEITPVGGALVAGGSFRHTTLEGFSRMPGEIFSPVWEGDTVLTENKVLQPQFATQEVPFVAGLTAAQPSLVPVRAAFGNTFVELTCTPLD